MKCPALPVKLFLEFWEKMDLTKILNFLPVLPPRYPWVPLKIR